MQENHQHATFNSAEVVLPSEIPERGISVPMISRSPIDLPVEGFAQALDRIAGLTSNTIKICQTF